MTTQAGIATVFALLAEARRIEAYRDRLAAGIGTAAANALLDPDAAALLAYAETDNT